MKNIIFNKLLALLLLFIILGYSGISIGQTNYEINTSSFNEEELPDLIIECLEFDWPWHPPFYALNLRIKNIGNSVISEGEQIQIIVKATREFLGVIPIKLFKTWSAERKLDFYLILTLIKYYFLLLTSTIP